MKYQNFAQNLKTALEASGITQEGLAELLGTTQATVSRWALGVNEPDLDTFMKICLFLNESPNELLGYSDVSDELIKEHYLKSQEHAHGRKRD